MELHDIPDSSQYRFHDGCQFCGSSAFWENTFFSVSWSLGFLYDIVVYNWRNLRAQKVRCLLNSVRTKKVLKVCSILKMIFPILKQTNLTYRYLVQNKTDQTIWKTCHTQKNATSSIKSISKHGDDLEFVMQLSRTFINQSINPLFVRAG